MTFRTNEVYGIVRRGVPKTYVSRTDVDDRFLNEITRDQHLVIYGSSKQGKSSLIQTALQPSDYISVQCATDWTKHTLYSAILRQAGVTLKDGTTRTKGSSSEVTAEIEAEVKAPFFASLIARLQGRAGTQRSTSVVLKEIPLDLSRAADVISLLEKIKFKKYIVVEDFHYLPASVQRELATDLKAFYEQSDSSFIIVGVWLEANRLIVYNGDLASRITSIPADTWKNEELAEVVRSGQQLLNITFSDEVVDALVQRAQQNVGTLQEAVRQLCIQAEIHQTARDTFHFDDLNAVASAYDYVANQLATRYANAINKFSEGLRDQVLHMYKWLMHAVIHATPDQRRAGLKTAEIWRHIQSVHPRGTAILQNSVVVALENVAKVQSHAQITPIIFDYDESHQRLSIVDNGFLVYLANTATSEADAFLATFENERPSSAP